MSAPEHALQINMLIDTRETRENVPRAMDANSVANSDEENDKSGEVVLERADRLSGEAEGDVVEESLAASCLRRCIY